MYEPMTNCLQYINDGRSVRTVRMMFLTKELLYDAANAAYIEGDGISEDDVHSRHRVMDITDDGNRDRVVRVLDLAHAACVEMLYPYTKTELPDDMEQMDNTTEEKEAYAITLRLPDGISKSTLELLSKNVHEYLVCRVVADWMSLTHPESTATWTDKADHAAYGVKTCLHTRMGRTLRRMSVF